MLHQPIIVDSLGEKVKFREDFERVLMGICSEMASNTAQLQQQKQQDDRRQRTNSVSNKDIDSQSACTSATSVTGSNSRTESQIDYEICQKKGIILLITPSKTTPERFKMHTINPTTGERMATTDITPNEIKVIQTSDTLQNYPIFFCSMYDHADSFKQNGQLFQRIVEKYHKKQPSNIDEREEIESVGECKVLFERSPSNRLYYTETEDENKTSMSNLSMSCLFKEPKKNIGVKSNMRKHATGDHNEATKPERVPTLAEKPLMTPPCMNETSEQRLRRMQQEMERLQTAMPSREDIKRRQLLLQQEIKELRARRQAQRSKMKQTSKIEVKKAKSNSVVKGQATHLLKAKGSRSMTKPKQLATQAVQVNLTSQTAGTQLEVNKPWKTEAKPMQTERANTQKSIIQMAEKKTEEPKLKKQVHFKGDLKPSETFERVNNVAPAVNAVNVRAQPMEHAKGVKEPTSPLLITKDSTTSVVQPSSLQVAPNKSPTETSLMEKSKHKMKLLKKHKPLSNQRIPLKLNLRPRNPSRQTPKITETLLKLFDDINTLAQPYYKDLLEFFDLAAQYDFKMYVRPEITLPGCGTHHARYRIECFVNGTDFVGSLALLRTQFDHFVLVNPTLKAQIIHIEDAFALTPCSTFVACYLKFGFRLFGLKYVYNILAEMAYEYVQKHTTITLNDDLLKKSYMNKWKLVN